MLPILCVSQNSNNLSLPKWIKYGGIDAVVISIPQMDTISVAFMERDFYKKKVETNKYRFDLLILDIEKLESDVKYKDGIIAVKDNVIAEKDLQIKTLKEQRVLDEMVKPDFWDRVTDWLIGFGIGAIAGLVTAVILIN